MRDATREERISPWGRLAAEVPSGGEAAILLVGPEGGRSPATDLGAVELWDPAGGGPCPDGPFDLVLCAEAIEGDPHPANLTLALWQRMRPGATLLLHARVMTDPGNSEYARFLGAGRAGGTEWVPGRLALRWTVETNGFDIERWIDPGCAEPGGEDDCYLAATRVERVPALVLATPTAFAEPDGESGDEAGAEQAPTMGGITPVVERQTGSTSPRGQFVDGDLIVFSQSVKSVLEEGERAELVARAEQLGPWLQGPFLIGGDIVVGGACRTDSRWTVLGPELPESLVGLRVLDIGANAGYDPFRLSLREPDHLLACEPFSFIEQARFLESIYQTGIELRQVGWQALSVEADGRFDVVHCHGVLYHEVDPLGLIEKLFEMTTPGGLCLFGSMMHADPVRADLSRLVPHSYFGDDTWWWVPGQVATRQMLESVGFEVEKSFGVSAGPGGEFPTVNGHFRAIRPL